MSSTSNTGNSSGHYRGEPGERYFRWQSAGEPRAAAAAVAPKFAPYLRPGDTVLDFGCGGGFLLAALPCACRLGVDLNPAALRSAAALGVQCYTTLAEVPGGAADVVISHHALEHVPEPVAALRELRAKLRPGGRLLLCVPIDDWRSQRVYDPSDINRHLYTWTPQLLGNALAEAGFDVAPGAIRILQWAVHPLFAGWQRRLPRAAFRGLCYAAAFALRRRELFAALTVPGGGC
ncbi:MAG TPA: class I SAM-dependent methyltransferase [Bryobacteraceae bacterium]|nr:class I SAM-dependent methyltransferase [Bryobacteraceae bacterium]